MQETATSCIKLHFLKPEVIVAGIFLKMVVAVILAGSFLFAQTAQNQLGSVKEPWHADIAPEGHFYQDLHFFANAKDTTMAKRYFLEWTSLGELAFFSVNDRFYFIGNMNFNVGLGSQGGIMIFDPRDVDIAFGLMGEYRFKTMNVSLDIDHRCFHQIDSIPWETMYWNRLTLAVSSPEFRRGAFRNFVGKNSPMAFKDRFAWQLGVSYYVKEFFGLLDPNAISYNVSYDADITGETRCVAYRWKNIAAMLNAKTGVYFTNSKEVKWNQQLGFSFVSTQGTFGLSLFLNWFVVDQLQIRQNRDRLMLFGINGYN
jgi:hypothetical protein